MIDGTRADKRLSARSLEVPKMARAKRANMRTGCSGPEAPRRQDPAGRGPDIQKERGERAPGTGARAEADPGLPST
ncbi:hypothetical protein GCM10009416_42590 [Craurococcus roseus]|uniref:Uncharacterized protein n=1 Tax=Craurococcus roseus TaxID=77585 RepID=A0ABP3QYK5_9PROT